MSMTALVAVSLHGVSAEQKSKLAAFLDGRDWIAVPKVEGAWAGNFPEADPSEAQAHTAICEHAATVIREAAQSCGLAQLDAVIQVGPAVPTLFSAP
jgi:hypothetical protein